MKSILEINLINKISSIFREKYEKVKYGKRKDYVLDVAVSLGLSERTIERIIFHEDVSLSACLRVADYLGLRVLLE